MRRIIAALTLAVLTMPAQAYDRHDHRSWGQGSVAPETRRVVVRKAKTAKRSRAVRVARLHPAEQFRHRRILHRSHDLVPRLIEPPLPRDRPLHPFAWLADETQNPLAPVVNIFRAFLATLVRPVGRCREFETIDPRVKLVVSDAAKHFNGTALAISCYRSPQHNARVRGAKHSQHMARKALDFRISGVSPVKLAAYARSHPIMRRIGGVGRYCGDFIHVDVGRKRDWNSCRRAA